MDLTRRAFVTALALVATSTSSVLAAPRRARRRLFPGAATYPGSAVYPG